ncbi:MAG: UDP-glucose--hexose-1-phosphate uridylyltransferase [Ruminococcaceae bacterium]|nr:UDP-glucose--hexose-1-phosphate uridylyltransferase [Oscillospiraceae bacterium]
MINKYLSELLDYGIKREMITREDECYIVNRILNLVGASSFERVEYTAHNSLEELLGDLCDVAFENGKLEQNTVTYRDILSAEIMDYFTPTPGNLSREFWAAYEENPEKATDLFYNLSKNSNYIMTDRVKRDLKWKTNTSYGELDITINLSKPEKDPKEIAAAKTQKQTGYPKCLLCPENVGFKGHSNHPPRANHRIISMELCGEKWALQYSPYVYYNEHCILLNCEHTPMKINRATFSKLLHFVKKFPHYFVGSNADLPIVGGSILTHDHFQGGNYEFPMAKCGSRFAVEFEGFTNVKAYVVDWALSTIRLVGDSIEELCDLGDKILTTWRGYSDESCEILAHTDAPHNTITPIARYRDGHFELDLILRNNRTTEEHPLGIFHPHSEYHHIKKENIGLIEAMGLAVLPARLKNELGELTDSKKEEVGQIFAKILENCGVFKNTEAGNDGMKKFVAAVNG